MIHLLSEGMDDVNRSLERSLSCFEYHGFFTELLPALLLPLLETVFCLLSLTEFELPELVAD